MMSERVDVYGPDSNVVSAAFESGLGLGVYQGTSSSGRESLLMTAKPKDLYSILYADEVTDGGVEELLPPETAPFSGRWLERGRVFWRGQKAVAVLGQPYSLTTEDLAELLELCERHRLQVDISMRSEWNPGETLGVLLWRQSLNPFIPPHLLPGGAI